MFNLINKIAVSRESGDNYWSSQIHQFLVRRWNDLIVTKYCGLEVNENQGENSSRDKVLGDFFGT